MITSAFFPLANAFVPKTLPTPFSKVDYLRYEVQQEVTDSKGNKNSASFDEEYYIHYIDAQSINVTSVHNLTFFTSSCVQPEKYDWYFQSLVYNASRLIYQTIAYPESMDYLNSHLRLYAAPDVVVNGKMYSSIIEIGYRWGTKALQDLQLTRKPDAPYYLGINTFDVMVFEGTDQKMNVRYG